MNPTQQGATLLSEVKRIGVLAHPHRIPTQPVAQRITEMLRDRQIDTWYYTTWNEATIGREIARTDMVIAIGGDGAMLKAARACAKYEVPVLGVNMGWLGFLTEINTPDEWDVALERVVNGDFWIEKRMMITASIVEDGKTKVAVDALNDVVISGNVFGRMIQMDTFIDKHWATTYNSDALIISTPTGSTAYALATGGPILPPELLNILIVPVAPHLSMDRPLVLSEGSVVDVRGAEENRNQIVLTVDGNVVAELTEDQHISVKSAEYQSRFVRLRERNYFYRSLLDRLEPRINRHGPRYKTFEE